MLSWRYCSHVQVFQKFIRRILRISRHASFRIFRFWDPTTFPNHIFQKWLGNFLYLLKYLGFPKFEAHSPQRSRSLTRASICLQRGIPRGSFPSLHRVRPGSHCKRQHGQCVILAGNRAVRRFVSSQSHLGYARHRPVRKVRRQLDLHFAWSAPGWHCCVRFSADSMCF